MPLPYPLCKHMLGSKKFLSSSAGQENDLKGNEDCFESAGGLSYRGFELPGVDCTTILLSQPTSITLLQALLVS